jgi:DNA-binding PadR family transcriptional regulator
LYYLRTMISQKELVILGMLLDKPMHGYEIEKEIEETSMRDWTELAFSSIYFVLKQLMKKNLIAQKIEMNEKEQTRKVYHITTEGKKLAIEKLVHILSERETSLWQMDLGLAYLGLLPPVKVVSCLEKYAASLDTLIAGYHSLHEYLVENDCPYNRLELANRSIVLLEAEKKWVQGFTEKVRQQPSSLEEGKKQKNRQN